MLYYQLGDDKYIYDGYIRDCPGLVHLCPSFLKVYTKAFTVDAKEFDRCLPDAGCIRSKCLCCRIGNGKIPLHVHLRMTILIMVKILKKVILKVVLVKKQI